MSGKEISLPGQKQLSLEILNDLDEFCQRRGLDYSLAYGTLIGAVRHKGFIPWDDDLDVMMPRKDYDILVSEWKPRHGYFRVNEFTLNKDYQLPFAKIDDTRTIREELGRRDLGVNIDVFPIDNMPDDNREFKKLIRHQKWLRYMLAVKKLKWKQSRTIWANFSVVICRIILKVVPARVLVRRQIANARAYNTCVTHHSGCLAGCTYLERERMDDVVFSTFSKLTFEGGSYSAISDYDIFLRSIYGDYMKLPPIEKQKPAHNLKCYWR